MKYTLEELHEMILPMVQSLGNRSPEELTGAIVELFKQDREAMIQANHLKHFLELLENDSVVALLEREGYTIDKKEVERVKAR